MKENSDKESIENDKEHDSTKEDNQEEEKKEAVIQDEVVEEEASKDSIESEEEVELPLDHRRGDTPPERQPMNPVLRVIGARDYPKLMTGMLAPLASGTNELSMQYYPKTTKSQFAIPEAFSDFKKLDDSRHQQSMFESDSPKLARTTKHHQQTSQQIRSSARFEANQLKSNGSTSPTVVEVADPELRPRLNPGFQAHANYLNCLSTEVGSKKRRGHGGINDGTKAFAGKSPYAVLRKRTLQQMPEIVSETRRAELKDFQHELKLFITEKLVQSGETHEFVKHSPAKQRHFVGQQKSLRVSSNVETENLHAVRQTIRANRFNHPEFNPSLDNYRMKKFLKDVYSTEEVHYQIEKHPEYLNKHISEFLHDTGAYKKQHSSLYELYQEKTRAKAKKKLALSQQEKRMLNAERPYLEVRQKKAKDEKYTETSHMDQLIEELRKINQERQGGPRGQFVQQDADVRKRLNDFVAKKLEFYSLTSSAESMVQVIKKPSKSLTRGSFDADGNYQPAMFEHLTCEKYYEYQAMEPELRPINWEAKLLADIKKTASQRLLATHWQQVRGDKEKLFKGTKFHLEITDIDQMRERVVRANTTPQRLNSLSQESDDERPTIGQESQIQTMLSGPEPLESPTSAVLKQDLDPAAKQHLQQSKTVKPKTTNVNAARPKNLRPNTLRGPETASPPLQLNHQQMKRASQGPKIAAMASEGTTGIETMNIQTQSDVDSTFITPSPSKGFLNSETGGFKKRGATPEGMNMVLAGDVGAAQQEHLSGAGAGPAKTQGTQRRLANKLTDVRSGRNAPLTLRAEGQAAASGAPYLEMQSGEISIANARQGRAHFTSGRIQRIPACENRQEYDPSGSKPGPSLKASVPSLKGALETLCNPPVAQKNSQMFAKQLKSQGSHGYSRAERTRRGADHQMSQLYDQYFKRGLDQSSAVELPKTRNGDRIDKGATEQFRFGSCSLEQLQRWGEGSYASQAKHHSSSRYTDGGGKGEHTKRSVDFQATAESTTLSTHKHSCTHGGSQLPAGTSRSYGKSIHQAAAANRSRMLSEKSMMSSTAKAQRNPPQLHQESRYRNIGSTSRFNLCDSSQALSQSNELSYLDRMTVRDIINACTSSIQRDGQEVTQDEDEAALAYAKLQDLYKEFTEQFVKNRQDEEVPETASAAMRQFFEQEFAKSRVARAKNAGALDETGTRSIWELMVGGLKSEEFEERVFHQPHRRRDSANPLDSYEFRVQRKTSKNPLVWKPDKLRYSKDMRQLLEERGFHV